MNLLVTHPYMQVVKILVLYVCTSRLQLILGTNADKISSLQTERLVGPGWNLQTVGSVFQVVIINAMTGQVIGPVTTGMTIFLSNYALSSPNSLNFVAKTTGNVRSVKLSVTGNSTFSRIENKSPWALCGNNKSNFLKCTGINLGMMTITLQPFSYQRGRGRAGKKLTVKFEIAEFAPAPTKTPTTIPITPTAVTPTRQPTRQPNQTASDFDITLYLFGTVDVDDNAAFPADAWKQVIVADLPNRNYANQTLVAGCIPPSTGIIDDFYICGKIEPIDGPSGILGFAGPTWVRVPGSLPFIGRMVFDSADILFMKVGGIYKSVILHEMGHVLGIGTLWSLLNVTGTRVENCPYRGINGNREYVTLSGCTGQTLPTEQGGGNGTRCSHFAEGCFIDELMTGTAASFRVLPLSRLTIATLEDIGYTVTYANAQQYTSASMNSSCVCNRRGRNLYGKQLKVVKPIDISGLDSTGSTTPWKQRKLSDEGYRTAYEFGQSILLQERQQFAAVYEDLTTTTATLSEQMQSKFIGANIVNVLYHDGVNGVFDVMVYG